MAVALTDRQLTGLDEYHLVTLPSGHRMHGAAAEAFAALRRDAVSAGFGLAIASSHRSFARQLAIWNGKARGERPVYDDAGNAVRIARLQAGERVAAIMRYSALPGASRHHWGTDVDVYDALALPEGYQLQLSPQEVAPGGMFDELHHWLDERMAAGKSHGFFRPYRHDCGGVAPERWHLSYAPVALECEARVDCDVLRRAWDSAAVDEELALREAVEKQLPAIHAQYVCVPPGWCEGR